MKVYLKFMGILLHDLNCRELTLDISEGKSLRDVIEQLTSEKSFLPLKEFFKVNLDLKRSLLIFINDQEISVLNGMDTELTENSLILFIPAVHGGNTILFIDESVNLK